MIWKEKTCEKCVFRVGDECRRHPPTTEVHIDDVISSTSFTTYPAVGWDNQDYFPACAEYAEVLARDASS